MRRVVDLSNFSCMGDCKDRLIKNSIVAGLNSTKAYQQCISKGSSLILNECIKICQTEDATHRQVQALCAESTDCTDSTSISKIAKYPKQQGRYNFRGRGAFRGSRHGPRGSLGGAHLWRQDYRYSTETVRTVISDPTNPEKNAGPSNSIKSAFIAEDLDTFQNCAGRIQTTSTVARLRSNT